MDGPCYPPTQTEAHLFCPRSRVLRSAWRPAKVTRADVGLALGRGVAAASSLYWADRTTPLDRLLAVAREAARVPELPVEDPAVLQALPTRLEVLVRLLVTTRWPDWTVLAVEPELAGGARPDLVVRDQADGQVWIVDVKTRAVLRADQARRTELEYRRSWQLWHYCWAWGQASGEPTHRYAIVMLSAEPTPRAQVWRYHVLPEHLDQWLEWATATWREMAAVDAGAPARGQTACRDAYGPCVYVQACWSSTALADLQWADYIPLEEVPS